ncbi:hypothetical protein BDE36_4121 [Arcticibacter tournemirensis]|uniref:hypothetical protein n=1 Tax=Arcticibacter tournemirensis TaxID=699437 RepID=UPI001168AA31|nr:hypothetical protein [Arcticibacter tournemirensis]TQM52316.1 hypothetical protein BDE36_4121 [Arcticibacter tournemirensis]
MKKNIDIIEINKLTQNTDKLLMQMLRADLKTFRGRKSGNAELPGRNQQAA